MELEIDAGYIRAVPQREGVRCIAVVASKLVRPVAHHGYVHAYAGRCHMRWRREKANALLRVLCAVLHGIDVRHFKRWYPSDRGLVAMPESLAA